MCFDCKLARGEYEWLNTSKVTYKMTLPLPKDILLEITSYLSDEELCNFALACRFFNEITFNQRFKSLAIFIKQFDLNKESLSLAAWLSKNASKVAFRLYQRQGSMGQVVMLDESATQKEAIHKIAQSIMYPPHKTQATLKIGQHKLKLELSSKSKLADIPFCKGICTVQVVTVQDYNPFYNIDSVTYSTPSPTRYHSATNIPYIPEVRWEEDEEEAPLSTSCTSYSGLNNTRILLVEDNLVNQKLLSHILQKHGFHIPDTVQDGQEALNRFLSVVGSDRQYDVILLNVFLPKMSSKIVASKIRDAEKELSIKKPVVIIGMSSSITSNLNNAEFNTFITKPVQGMHLMEILAKFNFCIPQ